jgi:hypothetical protein
MQGRQKLCPHSSIKGCREVALNMDAQMPHSNAMVPPTPKLLLPTPHTSSSPASVTKRFSASY